MSNFEVVARIAGALVAGGYLLFTVILPKMKKVPPCDTCKHLKCVEGKGQNKRWGCGARHYLYAKGRDFEYCCFYESRTDNTEKEGNGN